MGGGIALQEMQQYPTQDLGVKRYPQMSRTGQPLPGSSNSSVGVLCPRETLKGNTSREERGREEGRGVVQFT